jgi:hypothetical protein
MPSDLEAVGVAEMRGWWPAVAHWEVPYHLVAYAPFEETGRADPSQEVAADPDHRQDFGAPL